MSATGTITKARKGDLIVWEHVSAITYAAGHSAPHVTYELAKVASARRTGEVNKIEPWQGATPQVPHGFPHARRWVIPAASVDAEAAWAGLGYYGCEPWPSLDAAKADLAPFKKS